MRRFSLAVLTILPILLPIAGCATADRSTAPVVMAHSSLLFDRYPGYPMASRVAWRRDWPSTPAFHAEPESLYYRETIYDVQGISPHGHDYTYRRFDLHREGFATR